ncbi:hypothetical protein L202_05640 [Cryptococcus amylolentus CBS 6039]|uniref:Uncharacterized protein n=1 Tax=Cryptococcus amylolentus CBS 6039 TaxID=1295533 RepID=A0A1E3HMZ7_9TREE|nr:hypothetical protein L202_05640 [Cryptococcus amylolentus CBS 6039]ODN77106.1 hypothetical protein L202_05640 [Cryptococcus amylolentus CBS 6039]
MVWLVIAPRRYSQLVLKVLIVFTVQFDGERSSKLFEVSYVLVAATARENRSGWGHSWRESQNWLFVCVAFVGSPKEEVGRLFPGPEGSFEKSLESGDALYERFSVHNFHPSHHAQPDQAPRHCTLLL